MAIFGRKPREDRPGSLPADTGASPSATGTIVPTRDIADIGVPPYRPVQPEVPSMSIAPKPATAPLAPGRPTPPMVGVPARPMGVATSPVATARPEGLASSDRRTLVVGRGISLQGTVTDAERLVVEGTVESQMIQAAELFVAQSGVFRGEVQVEDAEIAGLFDGTLTVRGSLTIRGTGKVNGVARYRTLTVEGGGQVSGRLEMLNDQQASAPAPITTPSGSPPPSWTAPAQQPVSENAEV